MKLRTISFALLVVFLLGLPAKCQDEGAGSTAATDTEAEGGDAAATTPAAADGAAEGATDGATAAADAGEGAGEASVEPTAGSVVVGPDSASTPLAPADDAAVATAGDAEPTADGAAGEATAAAVAVAEATVESVTAAESATQAAAAAAVTDGAVTAGSATEALPEVPDGDSVPVDDSADNTTDSAVAATESVTEAVAVVATDAANQTDVPVVIDLTTAAPATAAAPTQEPTEGVEVTTEERKKLPNSRPQMPVKDTTPGSLLGLTSAMAHPPKFTEVFIPEKNDEITSPKMQLYTNTEKEAGLTESGSFNTTGTTTIDFVNLTSVTSQLEESSEVYGDIDTTSNSADISSSTSELQLLEEADASAVPSVSVTLEQIETDKTYIVDTSPLLADVENSLLTASPAYTNGRFTADLASASGKENVEITSPNMALNTNTNMESHVTTEETPHESLGTSGGEVSQEETAAFSDGTMSSTHTGIEQTTDSVEQTDTNTAEVSTISGQVGTYQRIAVDTTADIEDGHLTVSSTDTDASSTLHVVSVSNPQTVTKSSLWPSPEDESVTDQMSSNLPDETPETVSVSSELEGINTPSVRYTYKTSLQTLIRLETLTNDVATSGVTGQTPWLDSIIPSEKPQTKTTAPTTKKYNGSKWPAPINPCTTYKTLEESGRHFSNKVTFEEQEKYLCDKNVTEGWYEFRHQGEPAVVPTVCIKDDHCSSQQPQWLELGGEKMPADGEEVKAAFCSIFYIRGIPDCCVTQRPTMVRNCSGIYIYYLTPPERCSISVCTMRPGEEIPHEVMGIPPTEGPTEPPTTYGYDGLNTIDVDDLTDEQMAGTATLEFAYPKEPMDENTMLRFDRAFRKMLADMLNQLFPPTETPNTSEEPAVTPAPTPSPRATEIVDGDDVDVDSIPNVEEPDQVGPDVPDVDPDAGDKGPLLRRKREEASDEKYKDDDVRYVAPTPREHDDKLQVAVIVDEDDDGNVVNQEQLMLALQKLNETGQLSQLNMTLLAIYAGLPEDMSPRDQEGSLWEEHKGLFITLIVLAIICLIVIIVGLCCIKCRESGSWGPNKDQDTARIQDPKSRRHPPTTVENPMPDDEITKDEAPMMERENPALNGHQPISKRDEDNGWVVPIDQLSPAEKGRPEVEDTKL